MSQTTFRNSDMKCWSKGSSSLEEFRHDVISSLSIQPVIIANRVLLTNHRPSTINIVQLLSLPSIAFL